MMENRRKLWVRWHSLALLCVVLFTAGCPAETRTETGAAGRGGGTQEPGEYPSGGSPARADRDGGASMPAPDPLAQPEDAGPQPSDRDARVIEEPVTEADYYVRNERDEALHIAATPVFGDSEVALLEDVIPAKSEVHIYHAWEGSGGHAMPSNFFGTFTVSIGDEIIYEGVRNEDWTAAGQRLVLTIAAEEPPGETVDFACEQASDCAIKNVGNCCGYYPRCVNVDSPTPTVECGEGVGGVCGWPEISHCECVENTCRSMQGESEI